MSTTPLIPTWTMPQTIQQVAAAQPNPSYGTSFFFDFAAGDFDLDGSGRVQTMGGAEAWGVWCAKTVLTQRYAYLAYTNQYGCEIDRIFSASSRSLAEVEARQVIREALLADARTSDVSNFVFSWNGDALSVSFTATPTVGTPQQISVRLTNG